MIIAFLLQNSVVFSQFFVLFLWHGQAESDNKIVSNRHGSHLFSFQIFHSLRSLSWDEIAVPQLTHIIFTPSVTGATSWDDCCEAALGDLEIWDVQSFGALNSMGRIKVAKSSLTPHIQLTVGWEGRWKSSRPHFYHPRKGELFKESGQSTAARRRPRAKLALPIWAHRKNFPLLWKDDRVVDTAGNFGNFVRDAWHIVRGQLVSSWSQAKLSASASPTHEQSANVIHEGRMVGPRTDMPQIGAIVVVKVDAVGHESGRFRVRPALPKIVVAPREGIPDARQHHSMTLATRNWL